VLAGNLVSSLVLVPVTLTLREAGRGGHRGDWMLWHSLLGSVRQPLVWAPVAGLVLAFARVHLPEVVGRSMELVGGVTPGVSLFTLGLLLSQLRIRLSGKVIGNVLMKIVAQPARMGLLVFLLALRGQAGLEMIVLGALSTATIAPMLALQYKAYTAESSATVVLSTVLSVLTLAAVIVRVR
jgi:malonate transporter and related proteins